MSENLISIRRPLNAHVWDKDPDGFYVEPEWVSERLFDVEQFTGGIWDPCAGLGALLHLSYSYAPPCGPALS
jgi:hypothetical protein